MVDTTRSDRKEPPELDANFTDSITMAVDSATTTIDAYKNQLTLLRNIFSTEAKLSLRRMFTIGMIGCCLGVLVVTSWILLLFGFAYILYAVGIAIPLIILLCLGLQILLIWYLYRQMDNITNEVGFSSTFAALGKLFDGQQQPDTSNAAATTH